jgi:hypothetical protein
MMAYNKFWVALVMAAVEYLRLNYGVDFGLDEMTISSIVSFLTAFLVWLIPNDPGKPDRPYE